MIGQIGIQTAEIIKARQLEEAAVIIFNTGEDEPPDTRTLERLKEVLVRAGLSRDAVLIACRGGLDVTSMSDDDLAEIGLGRRTGKGADAQD